MLWIMQRWAAAGTMLLGLLLVFPSTAFSQETLEPAPIEQLRDPSEPLTTETVNALVSRLSDNQVRELLLERLDAVAVGQSQADGVDIAGSMHAVEDKAELIRERLAGILGAVTELPAVFPQALEALRRDRPASFFFWLTLGFAAMMLAGWLAEALFKRVTRSARQSILAAAPEGLGAKIGLLFSRLGLDLLALLVFLGGGIATFFILHHGDELTRITVMTYVAAIGVVRLFSLFSRFLLAPNVPALRLLWMPDDDARSLHQGGMAVAYVTAFGFFTCSLLGLLGISGNVHALLVYMVALVMTAMLAWASWRGRHGIRSNLLEGVGESRARRWFAEVWPIAVIAFVIGFFLLIVLITLAGGKVSYLASFGTLLTVVFLPMIDATIERTACAHANQGEQLQAVMLRALRMALLVGALLFIARIWEFDFHALAANSVGARFAEALIDIGLVMLIAYVLWGVARVMIDRRIEAEGGGQEAAERGDEGGGGGSRLGTLLPLIRRTVQVTIAVMAVMLVLSALGVNIGPLLAGAGVIGLAVGFGAQALVRDIVSGLFFLVDDAFRVGEYVDVGAAKGTVEKISIRSFQLRHHRGALNTVPFGEIQTLTNYSRDWVVMKLEFRLPFDTDIAKVKKIFKQIGKDLLEHPEIGEDFLAPFKSQGVFSVDDSALIIRAKFTAKPGKQFLIKREAYQAVQREFAANGIEFARKQVMVQIPEDHHDMTPEERQKLEQAAASAIAHDEVEAGAGAQPGAAPA